MFFDYFKKLFQQAEDSTPSNPVIREAIQRSQDEQEAYDLWKRTHAPEKMLSYINQQYANHLIEPENMDNAFGVLDTPSTKGFVMHFSDMRDNAKDYKHLFDFLREKVLAIGYKHYMSDTRTYNQPLWVENVERHYLKPPIDFENEEQTILKQRYGNILIELLYRNDHLVNLKFRATSYTDHSFTPAEQFSELMKSIVR